MKITKIDDSILIRSYLEGDEKSLEKLILKHKDRVFGYVYLIVKDHDIANDIFQDTFMKVVNTMKKGKYNEEGKFIQWTLRIAHNLAIDHFRFKKRMPTTSGGDDYDIFDLIGMEDDNMEEQLISEQIKSDVVKLMEHLPKDQLEVLKMRLFYEMSFKDIAEETNVSINTALGRMRYALMNLRKHVKERNIELSC